MKIFLDTSTPNCYLALDDGQSEIKEYNWYADRNLANGLLRYIVDKLEDSSVTLNDLSGIGIKKGPGSFTGLRIGLTVANTLATELHIPIVGATNENWLAECRRLLAIGQSHQIIMPSYGQSPNITLPIR